MSHPLGSAQQPLRTAIIGSGPSGFYAAASLLNAKDIKVKVDMFEKLPVPFGLVRYGVAPDHAKIKNVTKIYEKIAEHKAFQFLGNVHVGKNISVHDLRKFYEVIIFAIGAEADRRLGILGEDLPGCHTASECVGWYNGHPDFRDKVFNLSQPIVVIIGQGNVALDIARILGKTVDELKNTDIARHALEALAESKVREIHIFGRRGPAQAAFTPVEIRELGELADCNCIIDRKDLELNEASRKELENPQSAVRRKNYEVLQFLAQKKRQPKKRQIVFHFLKSPLEISGAGHLSKIVLEKNMLVGNPEEQKARGLGQREEISCNLLFKSIGYRGIPIKGLPFHDQWGIIPNQRGRVVDSEQIFTGLYAVGWIKRGPTGVIGTNKPDAEETVKHILEDIPHLRPCEIPDTEALKKSLKRKEIRVVNFADWKKIEAAEIERGNEAGKPLEKFVTRSGMLSAV
jgi:ferredoxin--NADP+ reductase